MEESENKDTNVKATIDAVAGLVTAIPIYQDTLQPAAKQIGASLETVTKTVNIVLAPIKALVWGYEKIESFISERVSEKLKNVPPENITTPPPFIAGPAVEALRFAGDDVNLRELYANLLASAMDISTQHLIHPGYVEILKNLCSDEANLLQAFIKKSQFPLIDINGKNLDDTGSITFYNNFSHLSHKCVLKFPELVPTYLNNISRLGLTEIRTGYIVVPNTYEPLENDEELNEIKANVEKSGRTLSMVRKYITITEYGKHFIRNVVSEKIQTSH